MNMNYKKIGLTIAFPLLAVGSCLWRSFAKITAGPRVTGGNAGLVVVKLDGIGDYILFRNFLKLVKQSKKYSACEVTLVGNVKFKDLAEEMDSAYVDHFIWVDRDKIFHNLGFNRDMTALIKALSRNCFDALLYATYSRSFLEEVFVVKSINARIKATMDGDATNTTAAIKKIYDRSYDQLVEIDAKTVFEFDRNRDFFEAITGETFKLDKPFFDGRLPANIIKSRKYVVLFPGASNVVRQWSPANFARIAEHISKKYGHEIVVAGSKADQVLARQIQALAPKVTIHDIAGKTTLAALASVIKSAELLISNDTSAVHVGACVGTETVFFLIGNNEFGRFGPYPPRFKNMHALYPIELDMSRDNYFKLIGELKNFPPMSIDDISPERVAGIVDKVL